jgi:hypothetical protein
MMLVHTNGENVLRDDTLRIADQIRKNIGVKQELMLQI